MTKELSYNDWLLSKGLAASVENLHRWYGSEAVGSIKKENKKNKKKRRENMSYVCIYLIQKWVREEDAFQFFDDEVSFHKSNFSDDIDLPAVKSGVTINENDNYIVIVHRD